MPIGRTARLESVASGNLDRPRFYAGLFGGFAAVALLLALVGVYATTAYGTRSRTREIGIRMALGAVRSAVVRGVVWSTGRVLAAGVLLGLAVAAIASRTMTDLLLYVEVRDVTTYLVVAGLVLFTGLSAAWVPARRSSNVDPAETLREA